MLPLSDFHGFKTTAETVVLVFFFLHNNVADRLECDIDHVCIRKHVKCNRNRPVECKHLSWGPRVLFQCSGLQASSQLALQTARLPVPGAHQVCLGTASSSSVSSRTATHFCTPSSPDDMYQKSGTSLLWEVFPQETSSDLNGIADTDGHVPLSLTSSYQLQPSASLQLPTFFRIIPLLSGTLQRFCCSADKAGKVQSRLYRRWNSLNFCCWI